MKILFAVSNENIAEAVKREYQNNYKAQLITKNVYYFNAVIKELQNNKTYDVVIISEDLEPFANNNYDTIDKFLVDKLQTIREEAVNVEGNRVPIIFITTDRHIVGDFLTSKLYEIGIYNALVGNDRSIENVCTLMFHPRKKQEARAYYRVNSEIDNSPKEDDVKEEEIKNIILHYKKLGKAEERYVESFNNIASQYNDAQLKVIIRFLPLNVKAVLEAQSPKYQSLTTFASEYNSGAVPAVPQSENNNRIKEKVVSVDTNNDRVLEQISSIKGNSDVVIPNAMNINRVRKIETDGDDEELVLMNRRKNDEVLKPDISAETNVLLGFEDFETSSNTTELEDTTSSDDVILPGFGEETVEKVVSQEETVVKRGRGRPRKTPVAPIVPQGPKRGRGRPRKVQPVEEVASESVNPTSNLEANIETVTNELPMMDEFNNSEEMNVLSGFDGNTEEVNVLPGFDNNSIETNDFGINVNESMGNINSGFENTVGQQNFASGISSGNFETPSLGNITKPSNVLDKQTVRYENIEYLIPADKRIASFIGTSKSGVSFIVNNLAQMLSSFNINVAILDLTKNKNSFYIYTNNDESLRSRAEKSIYNLLEGNPKRSYNK